MTYFPEIMVDVETGGTDPAHTHMLQIAAVRFNLAEGRIDADDMFNMCLEPTLPLRHWDEGTRRWWMNQPDVLDDIIKRGRDPRTVMEEFRVWAGRTRTDKPIAFWANHVSFDYGFVESYFRQLQIENPFPFWNQRDADTYLLGRGIENPKDFRKSIPFEGTAHDALHDVLHQIKVVLTGRYYVPDDVGIEVGP